jgi:hypothetical protein
LFLDTYIAWSLCWKTKLTRWNGGKFLNSLQRTKTKAAFKCFSGSVHMQSCLKWNRHQYSNKEPYFLLTWKTVWALCPCMMLKQTLSVPPNFFFIILTQLQICMFLHCLSFFFNSSIFLLSPLQFQMSLQKTVGSNSDMLPLH